MPSNPDLSIVVPLFNEADSLTDLVDQIDEVIRKSGYSGEVLLVDDGSTDSSWERVRSVHERLPIARGLRLRRNFGKATALATGIAAARGSIIVTMDADLQDEPAEIPRLIATLEEGYDAVSGWKQLRRDPWTKTIPSRIFNTTTRILSGIPLHDFNCGFKAYRAEAAKSLHLYGELHRFIPILLEANGYRMTEVPVAHHRRTFGVSKYGWKRLFKGGLDLVTVVLITRYLQRPGHFFGGFGILSGLGGFLILAWLSFQKLALGVGGIGQRPLFFLGILLLLLGAQLISTGLLGELLNRDSNQKLQTGDRVKESVG